MLSMNYVDVENEEKRVNDKIKASEFANALTILSYESAQSLQVGDVVLIELMRLGIVDKEIVKFFKDRFTLLLPEGVEKIRLQDLLDYNMIDTHVEVILFHHYAV